MFYRIRMAIELALGLTLLTSISASAKGNFSFITITGPNLKAEICMTDPVLTKDWFAFADISQANIEKPTNPGVGYEIIRYYMDVEGGHAFDHLHYYPDTGFVYYDGIVDGWSEADRKWYTAKPGIKIIFESALATPTQCVAPIATAQAMIAKDQKKAYTSMDQIPTVTPMVHSSSKASDSTTRFITPIMITVSLAFLFVLAFSFRKSFTR